MNQCVIRSMDDFNKICRCCVSQSDELSPIFQCGDTDENIPNMFRDCFNLDVSICFAMSYICCCPIMLSNRLTALICYLLPYALRATKSYVPVFNSKKCASVHLPFSLTIWTSKVSA